MEGDPPDEGGTITTRNESEVNLIHSPKLSPHTVDNPTNATLNGNVEQNTSERQLNWQFFNLVVKNKDGSIPEEQCLTDYDVAEVAIQILGFPAYDLSHLSSEMGPGKALIGLKRPCNILKKFGGFSFPFEYTQPKSNRVFNIDIKGLQNALDNNYKKKFRVEALRCVGQVPTDAVESALKIFAVNVKKIGYLRSEANKSLLGNHPGLKGLGNVIGSGSVEFEVEGEPSLLPTLLPVKGQIIRLRFPRMRKQCANCFRFNHTLTNCSKEKVKMGEYLSYLIENLKNKSKIPDNIKTYAQATRFSIVSQNTNKSLPDVEAPKVLTSVSRETESLNQCVKNTKLRNCPVSDEEIEPINKTVLSGGHALSMECSGGTNTNGHIKLKEAATHAFLASETLESHKRSRSPSASRSCDESTDNNKQTKLGSPPPSSPMSSRGIQGKAMTPDHSGENSGKGERMNINDFLMSNSPRRPGSVGKRKGMSKK